MAHLRDVELDFFESTPSKVERSATIDAPPDAVWDVLADCEGWANWFPAVTRAMWLSEPPHGLGSRRRVMIGPVKIDETFIGWEPGHLYAFCVNETSGPLMLAMAERAVLDEVDDGRTRVTYTAAYEPGPVLRPLDALFRRGFGKGTEGGLAGLARIVERRPAKAG